MVSKTESTGGGIIAYYDEDDVDDDVENEDFWRGGCTYVPQSPVQLLNAVMVMTQSGLRVSAVVERSTC